VIPIRDTIRSRSVPIVTWLIIAANTLVFFYELSLSPLRLERFIYSFALVPSQLELTQPITLLPFLTHMFMHSGWFHFISNMWILFIFGDNVEDRMGGLRFLAFYLLGGVSAGLAQTLLTLGSDIPSLGASGAIAAVMGAYFLFFPRARVITIIPLFIFPWFVEIPAIIFLGFWFVSQLGSGLASLATASGMALGGVAWWAHIGGFVFGLLLAKIFTIGRRAYPWYPDQYWPY
jgi:membrane associated rhomboid family serine protease